MHLSETYFLLLRLTLEIDIFNESIYSIMFGVLLSE